ncbi:sugar transferase [Robiginitalea sp. IMCC44478]|uniref:sugar transferase n=1 Tax=Robiginitalea sp. IMCC44478 TaxID=3459122 RepID=UPI0040417186
MYKAFGKRIFDFSMALIGFILLFPLFIILAIGLWITLKGNPFFTQSRPGKNEETFFIIKFRTMSNERDEKGELLPDNQRLTKIGAFIRRFSLDELPQLLNVIKGDMSLIGPRPLIVKYLPYYKESERIRHSVRPGITGLAQVSGRNNLNWDQKLQYDINYVKNLSFLLDAKILFLTIKKVFKTDDVVIAPIGTLIDLDEYRKNKSKK